MGYHVVLRLMIAVLTYLTVATGVSFFFSESHFHFYSAYYLLSLIIMLISGGYFLKTTDLSVKKIPPRLIVIICFLLVICFGMQWVEFNSRGIWLDEYLQFMNSSCFETSYCNISSIAAIEQQPPLDYFLAHFSSLIMGHSPLAVRFNSGVFGLMTIGLFPVVVFRFTKNVTISTIATLLFLGNSYFRFYSIEARPLMASLFFALQFLYFYLDYLFSSRELKYLVPVLITQILFSVSIGLQPLILIISLFIATLPLLNTDQRKKVHWLFLTNIISALIFIPHLINIFSHSSALNQFTDKPYNKMVQYFAQFDWDDLIRYFDYSYWTLVFCAICVTMGWSSIWKTRKFSKSFYFLGVLLIFPILFELIFNSFINWGISGHYHIVYTIIVFLSAAICYSESRLEVKSKLINFIGTTALGLMALVCLWSEIDSYKLKVESSRPQYNSHTNLLYEYIQSTSNSSDVLIYGIFNSLGQYRGNIPVALENYISNVEGNRIQYYENQPNSLVVSPNLALLEAELHILPTSSLYWVSWDHQNQVDISELLTKSHVNFEVKQFGYHTVFKISDCFKNGMTSYYKMLESLIPHVPAHFSAILIETMIEHAIEQNDIVTARKFLVLYKSIKLVDVVEYYEVDKERLRSSIVDFYEKKIEGLND